MIFCGKPFGPMFLVVFKYWIIFITSSGEAGDVKKVFRLGCFSLTVGCFRSFQVVPHFSKYLSVYTFIRVQISKTKSIRKKFGKRTKKFLDL